MTGERCGGTVESRGPESGTTGRFGAPPDPRPDRGNIREPPAPGRPPRADPQGSLGERLARSCRAEGGGRVQDEKRAGWGGRGPEGDDETTGAFLPYSAHTYPGVGNQGPGVVWGRGRRGATVRPWPFPGRRVLARLSRSVRPGPPRVVKRTVIEGVGAAAARPLKKDTQSLRCRATRPAGPKPRVLGGHPTHPHPGFPGVSRSPLVFSFGLRGGGVKRRGVFRVEDGPPGGRWS